MNHSKLLAFIAVAVLAAAYAAATHFVGHRVSAEVALLAQTLAQRDDVRVTRFEYDRGFRGGTLHYDLAWQPPAEHPRTVALREAGVLPDHGLDFTGTLQFRHGPWAGRQAGFALAGSAGALALPDPLREFLPQYPGREPVLEVTALVTLGGQLEARFAAIDYRGRIDLPELDQGAALELAGLEGMLRSNGRLDRLVVDVRLQEFAFAMPIAMRDQAQSTGFRMQDAAVELDVLEARPWVWTGTSRMALQQVTIDLPEHRLEMNDLLVTSDTWIDHDKLGSTSTMEIGPARLGERGLLGAAVSMSLHDLDVDAFAELTRRAERHATATGGQATEPDEARLMALFEQLLAGRPSLAIDRLSLSLAAPEDVTGRLHIGFESEARLSPGEIPALARALRAEAGLEVHKGALRHIAGLMVEHQLPPGAGDAERAAEAEAMYREILTGLQVLPFFTLSDEHVAAAAEIRQGRLWLGGSDIMDVDTLVALAFAQLGGAFGRDTRGWMNPAAEPVFGRIRLSADFQPDPHFVQVAAGGGDDLDELVGEGCVGWVNGERPDVVLSYAAGPYPLYIYATADFDTTLAVLDPHGRWHCNDDVLGRGFNPGLEIIDPASGDYVIWVGTFGSGAVAALLFFSENGMHHP